MKDEMATLGFAVEPVAPPPELRARLMAKIATAPVAEVLAGEGEWAPLGPPGVERKVLYREKLTGQKTCLLRLAPGAVLPAHRHKTPEQCMILEGDMIWDGRVYETGDFVVVSAETEHSPVTTSRGAVVLVVGG